VKSKRRKRESLSPPLAPDADLARVAALWPELPHALRRTLARWQELPVPIRAAILALVKVAHL